MNPDDIKFISIGLVSLVILSVLMYFIPWFVVGAAFLATMIVVSWTVGFMAYNSYMDFKERK